MTYIVKGNIPLALLAINEGSLVHAIGRITAENKGFINCSSGDPIELEQQKKVATRIISGEPFYIDGTSALILSESRFLELIYEYLPNLKVPQSVITLLLETKEKFRFTPGFKGHMGCVQGKLVFTPAEEGRIAAIQASLAKTIELLESNPQNRSFISAANKTNFFTEQRVPAELCDACILAQKDKLPVLTEDFFISHRQ